jgi:hypothetical protein
MIDPISIIAISAGAVLLVSSLLATFGVVIAPVVSTPADKYAHIRYFAFQKEKTKDS